MQFAPEIQPIDILLVDDDECDVLLTRKLLSKQRLFNTLNVVEDGIEAMDYLRREGQYQDALRPDLILLDLNMPRRDGKETLEMIKQDDDLKKIPVIVLTTSDADQDIYRSYELLADGFITKPVDLERITKIVQGVTGYWVCVVRVPQDQTR